MSESSRAIPERLGRYEIVERLAAGGMGEVFIARFVGPGGFVKPVALKRIHGHLAGREQFVNMLHDEANITASVRHPNIVATLDVGSENGEHFVVVDYVCGDPLSRLVKDLKARNLVMPPWVVAWIGAQIASALHAAHEAKSLTGEPLDIVHRDISLGNILLSDDGHPMLFDFGVAKARKKLHQTAQGELKGKLSYMAPEMFSGAPVTRSVDIFSLGVVLYELLTNYAPFRRNADIDTIMALKSGIVPPPSRVRQGVDPRLDPIVLTAMASERANRFTTAAQIEDGLRSWARATGAPHEPGPVANWIAWAFPERIAARRAMLARVGDPSFKPLPIAPSAARQTATSGLLPPLSSQILAVPPEPPAPSPTLPEPTPAAAIVPARKPSPLRWLAVACAATLIGGLLAYFVLGRGAPHHHPAVDTTLRAPAEKSSP